MFEKLITNKEHFRLALEEFQNGKPDPGILAMAMAESRGNDSETRSLYIKLRANDLAKAGIGTHISTAAERTRRTVDREVQAAPSTVSSSWSIISKIFGFILLVAVMAIAAGIIRDIGRTNRARPANEQSTGNIGTNPYQCTAGKKYNPQSGSCE